MAVVIVAETDGGDQAFYDQISAKAMPGGQLPEGCQLHIAGPTDGGWRVITIWDSEDQFQRFRNENLLPALRESGAEDRIAPRISANQVHRLITA